MFHQGWVGGCYFKTQPSQHVIYWFRTRKMLYHRFHPAEINQCLSGLFCRQLSPTTGRPARRRSRWPSERVLYFRQELFLSGKGINSSSSSMSLHVSSHVSPCLVISHHISQCLTFQKGARGELHRASKGKGERFKCLWQRQR